MNRSRTSTMKIATAEFFFFLLGLVDWESTLLQLILAFFMIVTGYCLTHFLFCVLSICFTVLLILHIFLSARILRWICRPWIGVIELVKQSLFISTGCQLLNPQRYLNITYRAQVSSDLWLFIEMDMTVYLQDRMLKRAFSKLKLEHVVIGKGQFHQERKAVNTDQIEVSILATAIQ